MALAHLGALVALADYAVALQVDRDLLALGMQMLRVGGTGPEDGVKDRRRASVRAGDGQTEFRDRPAFLFSLLGRDVVDMDQGY